MAKTKKVHRTAKKKENLFQPLSANVKVVGIGGGGGNAVARMAKDFYRGVDFIAINTDHQDLDHCDVKTKLYIGKSLTRGLGTGMNPDLGRQAAEENRSEISEAVKGADLVFISAGMGGGTGTGATPIVAEAAKQAGALTIAVVTKPFAFEGAQRERLAAEGLMKLKDKVDAIIVVPNDRIFTVISKDTPIVKAFEAIDEILRNALKGLVEMIAMPGIINVDFADVKNIMQDAGIAIVGVGRATGADRAVKAVTAALHSPLLETSPDGAKAVLLGITGGRDLKMAEVNDAAKIVAQTADPGARIIFGAYYDRNMPSGQLKVTIIAAGFNGGQGGTLFGSNGFESSSRQSIFGRPGFEAAATGMGMKRQSTPMHESGTGSSLLKEPVVHARGEESADELVAQQRTSSAPIAPSVSDKKSEQNKINSNSNKEKESDAWDIPAFLRRRKR
ncbi:MAG: cell division protein FtsZ [Candidatus Pacebacteria bacterium]|nr:cell division protein FtsZ [Candidatus Paceibacterota bacterium]